MTAAPLVIIRSTLFNIAFFGWSLLASFLFIPLFTVSSKTAQHVGYPWATVTLWLAKTICGITYEVRGQEHLTYQPVIYASKHQSAWDTIIFLVLFPRPAYILKRELLRIPFWGWYLWRMGMIAIDRSGKAASIKQMVKDSKEVLQDNRPIIIFPEGTRKAVGAKPHYHPGVVALYSQLGVPVIPVALNSGAYWGKNAFTKYPGTIIIEFLPPIASGGDKKQFLQQLQNVIEPATQRLIEESTK